MALTTTDLRPVAGPVAHPASGVATVDVAVPVVDAAPVLEPAIRRLHADLHARFPLSWRITIVDHGSTDGTWAVAQELVDELDGVTALHLDERGRGRALRAAWSTTGSPVVVALDLDGADDLDALLPLVAPLVTGHDDLATGARRGPTVGSLALRAALGTGIADVACGFVAARRPVAERLLPEVDDDGDLFVVELLVRAEQLGVRIHEVLLDGPTPAAGPPVLRRAARLRIDLLRHPPPDGPAGPLAALAVVGLVRTTLVTVLFALLADPTGPVAAVVVALVVAAVAARPAPGWARNRPAALLAGVGPPLVTLAVVAGLAVAGVTDTAPLLVSVAVAHGMASGARLAGGPA